MATNTPDSIRPTKKQRELLSYIEQFIAEHGYSPSYREIMNGLNYTSVATVSLHVTSLIRRGHLRKRDRSARSLEVVTGGQTPPAVSQGAAVAGAANPEPEEQWLSGKVEAAFARAQAAGGLTHESLDGLKVLVRSLEVLGMQAAAQTFALRLEALVSAENTQEANNG